MTIKVNIAKQITVNGETFSFGDFKNVPSVYLPKVLPLFRGTSKQQKDNETYEQYLERLFYLLYYKRGFNANGTIARVTTQTVQRTRQTRSNNIDPVYDILTKLGITVVKHSAVNSNILFKGSGKKYKIANKDIDALLNSIKKCVKYNKKDIDLAFGVELEFIGMPGCRKAFNQAMIYYCGEDRYIDKGSYNKNDGKKWILGRDGSLHWRSPYSGYELTSPILHFNNKKDIEELKYVISLITDVFHGTVNKSCGTHIHTSFYMNQEVTRSLCKYFAEVYYMNEENTFDKLVPSYRRKNNSRWCLSVRISEDPRFANSFLRNRYQKLNFMNIDFNGNNKLHLEFRQLDGTLDFNKIYTWIKIQKLFLETTAFGIEHNIKSSKINLDLNDVITSDEFSQNEVETLLKESTMIKEVA